MHHCVDRYRSMYDLGQSKVSHSLTMTEKTGLEVLDKATQRILRDHLLTDVRMMRHFTFEDFSWIKGLGRIRINLILKVIKAYQDYHDVEDPIVRKVLVRNKTLKEKHNAWNVSSKKL